MKNQAMQGAQHVLITLNGRHRTSHVSEVRIMKAVYEIAANSYVSLEKCIPVRIVREAEAFAVTYYADLRMTVYFRVRKTVLRMVRKGVSREEAADIMCDFFRYAVLPDMTVWTCEELTPPGEKSKPGLCVDGETFRYFGSADVMAALENIIESKSVWMLYDFTFGSGGYINIRRCAETSECKVECVRWTEPAATGYRAVISDAAYLRQLLWELVDEERCPGPARGWKSFDVADYFSRLTFKYMDLEDKSDDDER